MDKVATQTKVRRVERKDQTGKSRGLERKMDILPREILRTLNPKPFKQGSVTKMMVEKGLSQEVS